MQRQAAVACRLLLNQFQCGPLYLLRRSDRLATSWCSQGDEDTERRSVAEKLYGAITQCELSATRVEREWGCGAVSSNRQAENR